MPPAATGFPEGFDAGPTLAGPTLSLAPLIEGDIDALVAAASDRRIWAQHPSPDRYKAEVARPYFQGLLAGGGTLTARRAGGAVGVSRFYPAPDIQGSVSIGFTFLIRALWGGRANAEMKELMLGHAFEAVDTVWFHIGPDNIRSQKATEKIGATRAHEAEIDIGRGPVRMVCYALTRKQWTAGRAGFE
ncbi:MAG: GNAT family N-acetyltransferase [Pseudomonadota bacterium]